MTIFTKEEIKDELKKIYKEFYKQCFDEDRSDDKIEKRVTHLLDNIEDLERYLNSEYCIEQTCTNLIVDYAKEKFGYEE